MGLMKNDGRTAKCCISYYTLTPLWSHRCARPHNTRNLEIREQMDEPQVQDLCPEIEVLALGLPRCANASLGAALSSDILQYRPILRPSNAQQNEWDADIIKALSKSGAKNIQKRREHLCKVLRNNAASVETLNVLADDLMDVCSNAKLILNIRPPLARGEDAGSAWAQACRETIMFYATLRFFWLCVTVPPFAIWHYRYRYSTKLWRRKGLVPPSRSRWVEFNTGRAWMTPEFYHGYLAWVQNEALKRNREVLVWHAEQGWAPLCEFLGKPAPPQHVPFPHLNDRDMWARDRKRFIRVQRNNMLYSLAVFIIVALIKLAWYSRKS